MPKQWRVDLFASGAPLRFQHVAACPEISQPACEEFDIPDHLHKQTLFMSRINPSFSMGVGHDMQVTLNVPIDIKHATIDYVNMDDSPYDPPYGNIHHRNETLMGPADAAVNVSRFISLAPATFLVAGLGTSIPLGRTEEDPYALALEGLTHQHFQMGNGTFMPRVSLRFFYRSNKLGMNAWSMGNLSLYENSKGLQRGSSVRWGLGPFLNVNPKFQTLIMLQGTHEGRDSWNGVSAPSSGRHAIDVSIIGIQTIAPGWLLQFQPTVLLWQKSLSSHTDDQLQMNFIGSLGVSFTPQPRGH